MEMESGFNSWFIGSKGENAKVVEELISEAFRDHLYWRKNFHPEDSPDISENDKVFGDYIQSVANMRKYLFEILAKIKQSVPFYSPRYIGHMTSDPLIPGIIGYISTMFYNANNISPLGSPITTPYEIEVGRDFGRLVGFDVCQSWGHITSGGTVANLEAMWVARNLKYFPIVIRRVAKELNCDFALTGEKTICGMSSWELLNLSPSDVLSLREALINHVENRKIKLTRKEVEGQVDKAINSFVPSKIGWASFIKQFGKELEGIDKGVVLLPKTKHYSWTKAMDVFGMGSENLINLNIDENYRVDLGHLKATLDELAAKKSPIIMLVAVLGSTEEGSVDPLSKIAELCPSVYKHVDAAYGGYLSTLLYKSRKKNCRKSDIDLGELEPISIDELKVFLESSGIHPSNRFEYLYENLIALKRFDSITIDPHKLGYIPIPAGGIVFKDKRIRGLISFTAAYAFREEDENVTIGQYILEGSKPGASAVACYLAHKVVPPTIEGYGYILSRTIKAARMLYDKIKAIRIKGLRIVPITEPDTNVFCFAVNFDENKSLSVLNRLNREVYRKLSIDGREKPIAAYNFLISKTELGFEDYKSRATENLLRELGIPDNNYTPDPITEEQSNEIVVLRMCAMNPWSCEEKYVDGFKNELECVLGRFVHKILIIEDEESDRERIKTILSQSAGELCKFKYGDEECKTFERGKKAIKEKYDLILLDLLLKDEKGNIADGSQILAELRRSHLRKTPVVVYTNKEKSFPLMKFLEDAGFNPEIDVCIWKKDERSEMKVLYEIIERLSA